MAAEPTSTLSVPTLAPIPPLPGKRRRRGLKIVLALLVLLAVAVWFAPAAIAKTGLRNRFAREALADWRGGVDVGGASFGWFSPVELRDVTLTDPRGRVLVSVAKVTSSKTLYALLRDRSELGEFHVERPAVEVVCENGSTNLEDALANFLKDDGSPPGPTRTAVAVTVTGGKLTVTDTETRKTWVFESVEAAVTVPRERAEPLKAKLAAASTAGSPARIDADLTLGDGGNAALTASGFPLDSLAPAVRRFDPAVSVGGRLTADLHAEWGGGRTRIDGTATVADLDLAGPWFNGDRLKLASAELSLKVEVVGKAVHVERAELKCDVGTLAAVGSFDPDEPLDKLFDKPGVKLDGDIDLARLAARLPRLLRIREGTAIREGKLVAKLASRAAPTGTRWDGEIRTSALQAKRDGQGFEWAEPLTVEFSGRVPPGHLPTFDKLVCRSDFVSINAQGSPESVRAAANVYLGRLSDRLSEFVDLNGAKFTGNAAAWVVASRSPRGEFKADGAVEMGQFEYHDRAGRAANEGGFKVRFATAGQWVTHGPVRLDTGSANLNAGPDTLELKLLEPIPDAKQFTAAKLSANLTGGLEAWMRRVRGIVAVPKQYVFGGKTTASGTLRISPERVAIDRLLLRIQNARFRGAGLDLDEPTLNAVADMTVDRASGRVEFANFDITSAVLSVTAGRLGFEPQPKGELVVSGGGNAVTDLNRLGRTLKIQTDPKGSDARRGRGTGPIHFRNQGDSTTFTGTLDIKDFAYGDPLVTGLAEPTLKLELDGRYDDQPDMLTLVKARLERPSLTVEAKGTFSKFDTTQDVNLTGTLSYDLAKLTPELQKTIGGHFAAAGQGNRPFTLVGSLGTKSLAKLTADAGLGWDSVRAYGFEMGPGDLKAKLAGGNATFTPISATFGGGRITLTPALRLDPAPSELSFAKGKIVEKAKLTPQVCASGLGYALPVIANAAQAEGEISVVLDDNRIPLADATKAVVKGQIVVHKAAVGAGPIAGEIAKLLGAAATSITLAEEMTVPVRIEGGRVYHENLTLTVNGFVVRTSGSVGFDGSLAMVADVPIPPGLLKNNPQLMKAASGKTVKVPLTGTVAKPARDPKHFEAAVANLLRDAGKDLGRDFLNKELDKLFPGMPKK